jgi:hypothetical protein
MSEPIYCDIKGQYCRCHDFGKRCDDFDDEPLGYLYIRAEQEEESPPGDERTP